MSEPGGETTESKRPCGISSFLPLGMSCRGRAEAFARSLQIRLRSLGSQEQPTGAPKPDENHVNSSSSSIASNVPSTIPSPTPPPLPPSENPWQPRPHIEQIANNPTIPHTLLCLPSAPTSSSNECYYDINLEPDSPGSPAEECEITRMLETAASVANTSARFQEAFVRASPASSLASSGDSFSSSDGTYFDPDPNSEAELRSSLSVDYYDCDEVKLVPSSLQNGHYYPATIDSDSCSESLPNSQSTTSLSTFTANNSSASNNTLQEAEAILDLCMQSKEQYEYHSSGDDCEDDKSILESSSNAHSEVTESPAKDCIHRIIFPESQEIGDAQKANEISCAEENSDDQSQVETTEQQPTTVDDDNFCVRPRPLRRCSSLKTGKTPPGTPGHKKIVRFADVLGLDLADVKTFLDEIPTVPRSAYNDLMIATDDDVIDEPDISARANSGPIVDKILVPLFQQPGGMPGFLELVREQNVCLENAIVIDPICMTISGTVRVRNLDFNKSVHARYTLDSWYSYSDFQANYIDKSCDGFSDKFSFTIFGNALQIGQRLEMAIRFSCKGDQYWDSNFGTNYCFQCLPATSMQKSLPLLDPALVPETGETPDAISVQQQDSCSGTFY